MQDSGMAGLRQWKSDCMAPPPSCKARRVASRTTRRLATLSGDPVQERSPLEEALAEHEAKQDTDAFMQTRDDRQQPRKPGASRFPGFHSGSTRHVHDLHLAVEVPLQSRVLHVADALDIGLEQVDVHAPVGLPAEHVQEVRAARHPRARAQRLQALREVHGGAENPESAAIHNAGRDGADGHSSARVHLGAVACQHHVQMVLDAHGRVGADGRCLAWVPHHETRIDQQQQAVADDLMDVDKGECLLQSDRVGNDVHAVVEFGHHHWPLRPRELGGACYVHHHADDLLEVLYVQAGPFVDEPPEAEGHRVEHLPLGVLQAHLAGEVLPQHDRHGTHHRLLVRVQHSELAALGHGRPKELLSNFTDRRRGKVLQVAEDLPVDVRDHRRHQLQD
mmetsp:Transcript_136102/g.422868  ORF Transcript_136102/g.422868 Transcript_136102/m.422868 type:complete len:392 (+) Transcript_136102:288-1463(+)